MFRKIKECWTVIVEWWQHPKTGWFGIVLLMTAALVTIALIGWLWLSKILYAITGLAISAFYGCHAIGIFTEGKREPPVWVLHQMWFNFVGSAVGWLTGYYLLFRRMTSNEPVGITDILLLLVAVIGMTGHLPMCVISVPQMAADWLKRRLGLVETGDESDKGPQKATGGETTAEQ